MQQMQTASAVSKTNIVWPPILRRMYNQRVPEVLFFIIQCTHIYYSTACWAVRVNYCILYRCKHACMQMRVIVNIHLHVYVGRKQTLFYIFSYSGSRTCLVDGQDLTMTKINPDNHCIRELMALKCICPNRERGCPWTDVVELLRVIMIMRHITCTFYYYLYS